jgi:nucleoside-diphosphate-sugar epimerase
VAPKKQTIKKSALVPTVLISGGAGFIGSHLAESLLSNDARVIVLDNYKTGKDTHIKHLLNSPNFAFYNVDINAGIPDEIESVDYIIHLAGLEEYSYSKELVNLDSLLTNSSGTKNLLDLARASGAKFLLVSTVDVYQGKMSQIDLSKYFGGNNFDENKFSLTEAKRFAEAIVWEYFKKHDVDARIVRIPEVYGPRMSLEASGSLGGYLKSIIEGTEISIYGDGFEKEYYLFVTDVVSGLIKALFGPNTKGNIYSLVPDSPISSLELAYFVRKMADREINVQFKPRIGDAPLQVRLPDTFNLKDIDWKCKVDLEQGVRKTLEWFGYSVNRNSFKPAKFIQQKIDGPSRVAQKASVEEFTAEPKREYQEKPKEELFSLVGVAQDAAEPVNTFIPKRKKKIFFPKLSLHGMFSKDSFSPVSNIPLKVMAVVISALCVFVALPLGSLFISASSGVKSLQKIQTSISQLNSKAAAVESEKALSSFKTARKSLSTIKWIFVLLQKKEEFASYQGLLNSLVYFSEAVNNIGAALTPAESIMEVFKPNTSSSYDQNVIDQIQLEISKAQRASRLAEAEAIKVNPQKLHARIATKFELYKKSLSDIQNALLLASSLVSNASSIVGSGEEKNYIVWFQNSNEIRPTGGFIGSYGIIKVDKGKLKEVVIDDIYNPDGQVDLRNIVTSPPKPIIDYLAEKKLYLRNSNWDPDFTKAAKEFDDLYFKITGNKIDGYIAVDLPFVKNILNVVGPVFLAAYNEEINADNLYERSQFHSDFNYENGSDQKRSFLTILGSKLLERLFTLPKDKFPILLTEIGNSLEQKHLLVYFMNNQFNAFLKEKGWDGSLVQTQKDYLYVVNSNLGGTKANYYVKNKIGYEIVSMTRDGMLRANVYLDYDHTGKDSAWPGGPYKDYVRVLTQNGTKLTGAKIVRDAQTEEDVFKNVVIAKEGQYNSFELAFTLEPAKKIRVVISYDLPQELSVTKESGDYNLLWQKQPGTNGDQYSFVFNPPFGMLVQNYSENLKLENNTIKSEGTIQTNSDYFIKLQ